MKYVKLKGSRRTAEEQSYIWATMRMWSALPEEQRQQVRSLVEDIALTPVEGRALYDVMVRGLTPHSVAERVGMPVKRLYSMRREFIDRYAIYSAKGETMGKKEELTAKQKSFVREYLRTGDAAAAAVTAGYSPATAEAQGTRLLRIPAVQRYRRELEQRMYEDMGISEAWIGRRLVEIVDRCMQATPHMGRNPDTKQREPDGTWEFDPAGAMRALHELHEHLQSLRAEEGESVESFEAWLARQEGESRL